jgi:hypothetical protein
MKQVICDHCKEDLSNTGNSIDWRLSLINEKIPSWGGAVTDMFIYAPIHDDNGNPIDKHFCGMGCLKAWIKDE